jgi:hypothetical protein
MPTFVGLTVALAVAGFARITGLDRDRAFYPVVLIVVASYYVLFAVMAGGEGLFTELVIFALFAATAILGFRTSLWLVVAGLAMHGVFDFTRHLWLAGRGVPEWWPVFCGTYDLAAPAVLAVILLFGKHGSDSPNRSLRRAQAPSRS